MTRTSVLIIILSTIFLSCGNNNVPNEQNKGPENTSPNTSEKKTLKSELDSTNIWLNQDNAIPFLKNYFQQNPERQFKISTEFGDITLKIYEDTPIHSGNFLYLVKEKNYYENTLFYRVAPKFIIQGGDRDTDEIQSRRFLVGNYHLPAEFKENHRHFRGAVAMSRNYGDNPNKVSTSYDFYIVLGKKHAPVQLSAIERENNITYTKQEKKMYQDVGGAPHLDFQHTVFGEVLSGMEVVEKISKVEADKREWPFENITMQIEIIK